jgi:hypothetical protein
LVKIAIERRDGTTSTYDLHGKHWTYGGFVCFREVEGGPVSYIPSTEVDRVIAEPSVS